MRVAIEMVGRRAIKQLVGDIGRAVVKLAAVLFSRMMLLLSQVDSPRVSHSKSAIPRTNQRMDGRWLRGFLSSCCQFPPRRICTTREVKARLR